jgi:hypothetical protein
MKHLLNSNLLPIISVAMYNSHLSAENLFDDYCINEDKKEGYIYFNSKWFWDNFDNDAYTKHIAKCASDFLDGVIESNGIKLTLKCGEIYSPKYYNFANDEIDITVKFDKRKVLQFARKNKSDFNAFLRKNYSSYDGFSSSTSDNYTDWLIDFENENSQSIGAILTFLLSNYIEDNIKDYNVFLDYVSSNTYYTEFVNFTEYDKEVQTLENIVQQNYLTIDIETFTFESEILDFEAVQEIVKETIKAIESNTLNLL